MKPNTIFACRIHYSAYDLVFIYYLIIIINNSSLNSFRVFQLPVGKTFIEAFDFYFKTIKVFDVFPDKAISQFFAVFEQYVYGMRCSETMYPNIKTNASTIFSNLAT